MQYLVSSLPPHLCMDPREGGSPEGAPAQIPAGSEQHQNKGPSPGSPAAVVGPRGSPGLGVQSGDPRDQFLDAWPSH